MEQELAGRPACRTRLARCRMLDHVEDEGNAGRTREMPQPQMTTRMVGSVRVQERETEIMR